MNYPTVPAHQDFNLEGVSHISPLEAYALLKENTAVCLDVRDEEEWFLEVLDVKGTIYIPMPFVIECLERVPNDKLILVACANGLKSTKVAFMLQRQGYKQVVNLDGGLLEWVKQGLPVKGAINSGLCACGCADQK